MKHLVLFMFFWQYSYSQYVDTFKVLVDYPIRTLTIDGSWFLYKNLDKYCSGDTDLHITDSPELLIAGTQKCSSYQYFKVIYNNEIYYIDKRHVNYGYTTFEEVHNIPTVLWKEYEKRALEYYPYYLLEKYAIAKAKLKLIEDYYKKCKPFGIALVSVRVFDQSEHTKGTGLKILFANTSNKTIKYIWFTYIGKNRVNDTVGPPRTVRCVGPVEPGESTVVKYDYTWLDDLVHTAKIQSYKIQYMDGTFKVNSNPSLVLASPDLREVLLEN